MNIIELNIYPVHPDETFILILPSNRRYEVGQSYFLVDYFTKEIIAKKSIAFKETKPISQLTDQETFLAKNCDKRLFYSIIRNQFKKRLESGELYSFVENETMVDVLTMTNKSNLRSYKDVINHYHFEYEFKSMTSNKNLLSKNYCHKSKWNFLQQRPYTELELSQLETPYHD